MRKKTIEKIKKELGELEFRSYFPIEVNDDGDWRWTDDALDVLSNYVYKKIAKVRKYYKTKQRKMKK
jgi:hypothetical protein